MRVAYLPFSQNIKSNNVEKNTHPGNKSGDGDSSNKKGMYHDCQICTYLNEINIKINIPSIVKGTIIRNNNEILNVNVLIDSGALHLIMLQNMLGKK